MSDGSEGRRWGDDGGGEVVEREVLGSGIVFDGPVFRALLCGFITGCGKIEGSEVRHHRRDMEYVFEGIYEVVSGMI